MPQRAGPERAHFGGVDGLVKETSNDGTRCFWRCMHCDWEMGGKTFQNAKARIHLSGDPSLRNGMISRVCTAAPEEVKNKFKLLEMEKRKAKMLKTEKRKRAKELLSASKGSPATKQTKLRCASKMTLLDDHVDNAWGEFFFGLDVAVGKVDHALFKNAIAATKRSKLK